jgi:hypothetical protein
MRRNRGLDDPSVSRAVVAMLAVALVVTLMPASVSAVGSLVSIVDGDGSSKAQVDSGKLRVGDGHGGLTVDGKVKVSSALTKPLPVRDFGTPVEGVISPSLPPGETTLGDSVLFTVPQGKRLVVQTVSVLASLPNGQQVTASDITTNQSPGFIFAIPLQLQGTNGGGDNYGATVPVRAYVNAGNVLQLLLQRNGSTGSAFITASFSGYLLSA